MDGFFDDLRRGNDKLNVMMNCILEYLQSGQNLTLELKGFASPIARDDYNEALSKRRIDSVRKSIYAFRGGALNQYLESGQLKLIERPFGETMSQKQVSDSRARRNKSVYSPEAARERRVEIHRIINN